VRDGSEAPADIVERTPAGEAPAVRVAVLGCGCWGGNLARAFHSLGSLAAVHDREAEAAGAAAGKHVFVEEPLALSLDDAAASIRLATARRRRVRWRRGGRSP
jgi:predicted dehydrogenase